MLLTPSSHLKRGISKQELGLIWGPQIDCILQPGCGDLRCEVENDGVGGFAEVHIMVHFCVFVFF